MKVIVADDEPMIRAGLEKILSKMDSNIVVIGSYSNGFDALTHINRLEDHELDVLITDIKMPKMDGLKLIEAVNDRSFAKLIFSGFSEFEYARKAIRCGVCDYLLKPIDKQQLAEVLQRIKGAVRRVEPEMLEEEEGQEMNQGHHAIHSIKSLLLEQYDRNLELEYIAEQVGMSAHYVSRLFKQMTGSTITDHLIVIRIEKAKQFLTDHPHMKNYEIAQSVGYSDPVYFQKLFKKITGCTPKEYKKLHR